MSLTYLATVVPGKGACIAEVKSAALALLGRCFVAPPSWQVAAASRALGWEYHGLQQLHGVDCLLHSAVVMNATAAGGALASCQSIGR